jgi:hypothetical protein
MAGRVLLRAAAFGLAAAGAGSLHAVSKWTPPREISPFLPSVKLMLLESANGLQSALLRAHPLSGAHLRDVRARAELDLARVDVEIGHGGDPAAAADLRLLLALLATRDGRADDAMRLYAEAARDAPFDPRPRALAYNLCFLSGRDDESAAWRAAYHRLVPGSSQHPGWESHETRELVRELVVAATLGGVHALGYPEDRSLVMRVASSAVDKGLVAALQDKALSATERLQFRLLRVFLDTKVRRLVKEEELAMADIGDEASSGSS